MSRPFKLKYKNVEGSTKKLNLKGFKLKSSKKSKLRTSSFVEGSGGKGEHKLMAGAKIRYQGKYGDISANPTILSEKGEHHSFIKPDFKIGISTNIKKLKKLFKG